MWVPIFCLFSCFLDKRPNLASDYVTEVGLEFLILLPQPPKYQDFRLILPHPPTLLFKGEQDSDLKPLGGNSIKLKFTLYFLFFCITSADFLFREMVLAFDYFKS